MVLVQRNFTTTASNQLGVAYITDVSTSVGFGCVAVVTDVLSRPIVGSRVTTSLETGLTLDALEQAIQVRNVGDVLVHHSDRGPPYLSVRYTNRLAEVGIRTASVRSTTVTTTIS